MLGTDVRPSRQGGQGVGGGIEAFTGIGKLGFLDTMDITLWEPPHRCHVLHTGRLVRGTGAFEVEPRGEGLSTFVWREDLELPLGPLGRAGWPLVKPVFAFGVNVSLKRFAPVPVEADSPAPGWCGFRFQRPAGRGTGGAGHGQRGAAGGARRTAGVAASAAGEHGRPLGQERRDGCVVVGGATGDGLQVVLLRERLDQ